jgi:hypothetical protein
MTCQLIPAAKQRDLMLLDVTGMPNDGSGYKAGRSGTANVQLLDDTGAGATRRVEGKGALEPRKSTARGREEYAGASLARRFVELRRGSVRIFLQRSVDRFQS